MEKWWEQNEEFQDLFVRKIGWYRYAWKYDFGVTLAFHFLFVIELTALSLSIYCLTKAL